MYPPIIVSLALALTDAASHNWRVEGRTKPFSDRAAAKLLGISGHTRITTWRQQDNSEVAVAERKSTLGRKRKLTDDEEATVMAWAKKERRKKRIVKARQIRSRVSTITNGTISVSPSKVSRLAKGHKMSSQRTKRRSSDKNTPEFEEKVFNFRAEFQRNRVAAAHTLVMDEAGVYDNDIHPYCYQDIGSGGAEVEVPPTGQRDTIVATLRGDGTTLPAYYIHHQRAAKRQGRAAVKGMNALIMLDYINTVIAPNIGSAKQIFMDQLGAHKTKAVRARLEELGLKVVYFPAKTSSELSPCDNSFFHQMKSLYRDIEHNNADEKKAAVLHAYGLVQPKNIVGYFRQCGLTLQNRNKKAKR